VLNQRLWDHDPIQSNRIMIPGGIRLAARKCVEPIMGEYDGECGAGQPGAGSQPVNLAKTHEKLTTKHCNHGLYLALLKNDDKVVGSGVLGGSSFVTRFAALRRRVAGLAAAAGLAAGLAATGGSSAVMARR
jgi:hypothetical protein